MAETSSPQFVMARSVTCAASGVICLVTALILGEAMIRMNLMYRGYDHTASTFRWSTPAILVTQSFGVVVGTVGPIFRWFSAISIKCSNTFTDNLKNEFKVEDYWIQRLVEWKERPLPFRIQGLKRRKLIQDTKRLVLNLCIAMQYVTVLTCKAVWFISIFLISPFFSCFRYCKRLIKIKFIPFFYGTSGSQASPDLETLK